MTGSARLRILGWQLLLVALALAGSVLAARQVLLARVDERVDQGLAKEVSELRRFVDKSVDPATERSQFADVRALLETYLERAIPDRNQTMLALVNGDPTYRSAETPPYRLDGDRAAIDAFVSSTSAGQPHYGRVATPAGAVRYVAVPVSVQGHPERGVFVSAVFVDRERAEVDEVVRVLGVVGFGALAVAGAAGWMVAGRVLAPVRMVRRTAQTITETDLSRRIPVGGRWGVRRPGRVAAGAGRDGRDGRDEITELARTFNGMLDRLEQAFATQRAFVDDAGHELRTPITIIRGHLELLGDDPDERAETIPLVLDELDRMSRMVDDLLVLAKAEQPDFLRRQPVDLAVFTTDLFVKARALAPRAWRLEGVGDGRLLADRQRLTQALLQLAQNATQQTGAGGAIGIGSAVDDDIARFWVTDSGPGVAPADRARIFERFARGVPTRPPSAAGGGAGLGLAIVRAIATAHGGAVRVSGEPGEGATFILELSLLDQGLRDHEPRRPALREPEPDGGEPGGARSGGHGSGGLRSGGPEPDRGWA
ncbi:MULTISPECIES: sensor histidine kinase [Pseudofrankia]|uniref:sensor histidine kinase n=1 Tax=Pseudofrankia TaxID=2994363 RepID=UPI000234BF7C|nr:MULTISPECIES: HAMP domain-containing sensor histidine kinase [Pseudofrankia]